MRSAGKGGKRAEHVPAFPARVYWEVARLQAWRMAPVLPRLGPMRGLALVFLLSLSASARDIIPVRASSLRVTGSPELGKPYLDDRVFPGLTFASALDLVPLPGGKRWIIAERTGKIWSFAKGDNATTEKHLFADLKALHPETDNVYGVQFHPESFLTHAGMDMLRRFLAVN